MKKIFLLTIAGALAFGANAQQINAGSNLNGSHKQSADEFSGPVLPLRSMQAQSSGSKTTAGGSRWFSHISTIKALNGNQDLNGIFAPIWFDPTVMQRFTSGLDTINYSSGYQYINPTGWKSHGYKLWADNNIYTDNPIVVGASDAYTIDSIRFVGAYLQTSRPSNIVDTLIITVAQTGGTYRFGKATSPWVANYIPSNKDSLIASAPYSVDSINRGVFASAGTRQMWKVYLTDADRDTGNAAVKAWTLAVPNGGVAVAAGNGFSFTVTFKSGDTWTPYVDSFNKFHNFRLGSAYLAENGTMLYKYYEEGDRNSSGMMFSWDSGSYYPSVAIEGWNPNSNFRYEYHQMEAMITCPTCVNLSVPNMVGNITNAAAYPNPASNHVYVPFKLNEAANVTVSITNAVGQVIKSQDMGFTDKGQPEFSVTDMPNGLYFYVVEANGERSTGRVVVAH